MDNTKAAEKVKKLREQAKDKSLPQEVRNQLLDNANIIEESMAKKAGVKMNKGGMVPSQAQKGLDMAAAMQAKKDKPMRPAMPSQAQQGMDMAAAAKAKRGFAKGGVVKAACGASVPAAQKRK
jgi:hypothetical protein